jgi:hypothetical protein
MSTAPSTPDTPTTRRLAVEACVDPRTITRVATGVHVRGDAARRAREALERHGWRIAAAGGNDTGRP